MVTDHRFAVRPSDIAIVVIGGVKAALVAAFFMQPAHGGPVHRLVFAVAVIFLALLVLASCRDYAAARLLRAV